MARVSLLGAEGALRPPGHVARELREDRVADVAVLEDHLFGTIPTYARLLCRQLALVRRPWVVQADAAMLDRSLLRLSAQSGFRGFVLGPDPDPTRLPGHGVLAGGSRLLADAAV